MRNHNVWVFVQLISRPRSTENQLPYLRLLTTPDYYSDEEEDDEDEDREEGLEHGEVVPLERANEVKKTPGMNCIKIGLPGKLILSRRKGLLKAV